MYVILIVNSFSYIHKGASAVPLTSPQHGGSPLRPQLSSGKEILAFALTPPSETRYRLSPAQVARVCVRLCASCTTSKLAGRVLVCTHCTHARADRIYTLMTCTEARQRHLSYTSDPPHTSVPAHYMRLDRSPFVCKLLATD